jgi:hypothetical protein
MTVKVGIPGHAPADAARADEVSPDHTASAWKELALLQAELVAFGVLHDDPILAPLLEGA